MPLNEIGCFRGLVFGVSSPYIVIEQDDGLLSAEFPNKSMSDFSNWKNNNSRK